MMKIKTTGIVSLGIALTTTAIVAVFDILVYKTFLYLAISIITTFLAVFYVSRYFVRKFFIYKIKPIYQIMMAKNISTHQLEHELSTRSDVVAEIRDELTDWADKKSEEINRLKDSERFRKDYMGNVAHELKTPVFTIQGYVLTLLDGALEDEEINRVYLERTDKNVERLLHILNDLDEIAKYESGELGFDRVVFDVKALAREIIESLEIDSRKYGVTIKTSPNNNSPIWVNADRNRITQVLMNLVTNSLRYGKKGGTTKIGFVDMFEKVMVEVEDDGIGIAKEHMSRIFERFYRVDKSRSREHGGTGLGLSIVKHILEAHGEQISCRSELGKGTTFSFSLTKGK